MTADTDRLARIEAEAIARRLKERADEAEAALARVKALARRYADLGRTEHPRNITKSHDACLLRDLVVLDLQQAITGDDPAPLMDDRSDS